MPADLTIYVCVTIFSIGLALGFTAMWLIGVSSEKERFMAIELIGERLINRFHGRTQGGAISDDGQGQALALDIPRLDPGNRLKVNTVSDIKEALEKHQYVPLHKRKRKK